MSRKRKGSDGRVPEPRVTVHAEALYSKLTRVVRKSPAGEPGSRTVARSALARERAALQEALSGWRWL